MSEEQTRRPNPEAEGYRLDRNTWRAMVVRLAGRTGFAAMLPLVPSPHHGHDACNAIAEALARLDDETDDE